MRMIGVYSLASYRHWTLLRNSMSSPNHKERAHALLSASSSSRWLKCTPSAVLSDQYEDEPSTEAMEGTLAHEICDLKINEYLGVATKKETQEAHELLKKDELYHPVMERHTDDYTQYCTEIYEHLKRDQKFNGQSILAVKALVEERIDYSEYVPEGFGTGDFSVYGGRTLHVVDFKYGRNVRVYVENNSQLKLYALGMLLKLGTLSDLVDYVVMHLHQPRMNNIAKFTMLKTDLIDWAESIRDIAKKAFNGEGDLVAGEHCRFCDHLPHCDKQYEQFLEFLELSNLEDMTDEQYVKVFANRKHVVKFIEKVEDFLKKSTNQGKKYEGLKLVKGKSYRKYKNDKAVGDALIKLGLRPDQIYNTKIIGITALENLISVDDYDKHIGPLIYKPEVGPKLVLEADRGVEIGTFQDALNDFGITAEQDDRESDDDFLL